MAVPTADRTINEAISVGIEITTSTTRPKRRAAAPPGGATTAGGADRPYIEAGTDERDVGGERFAATAHLESPYDPKGARIRA